MSKSRVTQDIKVLTARLREEQRAAAPDAAQVVAWLGDLGDDGAWPDVNYDDRARTHWSPSTHARRLADLARAYRARLDAGEGDERLLGAILRALRLWIARDPQSDNWWFNCIDTPKQLGFTLLLLGEMVPSSVVDGAERIIRRSGFTRTGANLTWESGNLMVLALVRRDESLLRDAVAHISAELRISTEEGVQPDFSFHQHGPQLYMSNYGEVFSTDLSRYAALFAGTSFAFSQDQIAVLSGLILEGQQWFIWGGQFDYHAMGRQIDSPGAIGRGRGFSAICERMKAADPARASSYDAFARRARGETGPGDGAPAGNRHYWRSDTMVHRTRSWYASVRAHSTRTFACEVRVNRENLKGYHLSDGCHFLLRRGDEFLGVQPVWDWRKLPGVTARETADRFPYGSDVARGGTTGFVGGVSDGRAGAAVYEHAKDGVRARKAWFFSDAGFVCLGAGISGETNDAVTTSVNQCLLRSPVHVVRRTGSDTVRAGRSSGPDIRSVHHDGVLYLFPDGGEVTMTAGPQSGAWSDIEEASPRKETVTEMVFSLRVEHGRRPLRGRFACIVVPGVEAEDAASRALSPPAEVAANRADLQAVRFPGDGVTMAAFHEAGALALGDGLTLSPGAPCVLLVRRERGGLCLSVAEPTQTLPFIPIRLSGRWAAYEADPQVSANATLLTVPLPTADGQAGKTVTLTLRKR